MDNTSRRRWAEIVDAAARVFDEKGYQATTMQDVADELGILKGSVYHYIKSKEDLLFAVVEDAHESSAAIIENLREHVSDPATDLASFIHAHLEMLLREGVKFNVYLHDSRSLSTPHRRVVTARRREYTTFVETLIERGQKEGVFTYRADPRLGALAVLGMINWTYQWYRKRGEFTLGEVYVAFVEAGLRSVGADEVTVERAIASRSSLVRRK